MKNLQLNYFCRTYTIRARTHAHTHLRCPLVTVTQAVTQRIWLHTENHLPSLPWHLPPPCSPLLSRTPSPPPPQNHSPSHTETCRGCTQHEGGQRKGRGGRGLTWWTVKGEQISECTRFGDHLACGLCIWSFNTQLVAAHPACRRRRLHTATV